MKSAAALTIAVSAAFSVMQTASGATWRLLGSDSGGTSAFTNAYSWVSTSDSSKHSGNRGEALSSTEHYKIRSRSGVTALTLSGNAEDTVFKGKVLSVGEGSSSLGYIWHLSYGAAKTSWDDWGINDGIEFNCGYYIFA